MTFLDLSLWPLVAGLVALSGTLLVIGRGPRGRWLMLLAVIACGIAILHPALILPERTTSEQVTILLDVSDSVAPFREQLITRAQALLGEQTSATVVPFSSAVGDGGSWRGATQGGSETNLEVALNSLPRGSIALLLTDGGANRGSVARAVAAINEQALTVALLAPIEPSDPPTGLVRLDAPTVVQQGKGVKLLAVLANRDAQVLRGTIRFFVDDREIRSQEVTIGAEATEDVTVESGVLDVGTRELRAVFIPDGASPVKNELTRFTEVRSESRVYLWSSSADERRFLEEALTANGFSVQSISSLPPALTPQDLVVVQDVPAQSLGGEAQERIRTHVEQGGGLLYVGGARSFGLGGYRGTVLGETLPLESLPPQRELRRVNTAIALVIDKSRSMANDDRLEFAKEAAAGVVNALKDDDLIGIIGFDDAPFIALSLAPLSQVRERALDRLRRLVPAGRTNLLPALDEARRFIERAPAGRKHIIVLTDGRLPDSVEAGPFYLDMVKDLRITGVTVSTMLVGGEGDDGLLRSMASSGGGTFYETRDPRNLPRIVLQDVRAQTAERTMQEGERLPVQRGPGGVVSTTLTEFPALRGFVATRARERATTELVIAASEGTQPLLGSWSFGRGKVVAFASDANGRWSQDWIRWGRFRQFWGEVARSVLPGERERGSDVELQATMWGDDVKFAVTLFRDALPSTLLVERKAAGVSAQRATLSPVATGRYEGTASRNGATEFSVVVKSPDGEQLLETTINLGDPERPGNNHAILEALTDGGAIRDPERLPIAQGREAMTPRSLQIWCIVLAFLFLLGAIVVREWRR